MRVRAFEAMSYDLGHTAQALSALGEIRLRQGDLDAARSAFDRADAFGLPAGPGPAALLLATGDATGARSAITSALGSVPPDPLTRARYLPTAVRAAVAVGDLDEARSASRGAGVDRGAVHRSGARGSVPRCPRCRRAGFR